MDEPVKQEEVWILWGSSPEIGQRPSRYAFDTHAEMNAFLEGVNEASGWLDHEQFDTYAEFEAYQREIKIVDKEIGDD